MFTTNNIADTAAEPGESNMIEDNLAWCVPAHETTENTEEYEDPASNDEDKGEPVEPPVTSLETKEIYEEYFDRANIHPG